MLYPYLQDNHEDDAETSWNEGEVLGCALACVVLAMLAMIA